MAGPHIPLACALALTLAACAGAAEEHDSGPYHTARSDTGGRQAVAVAGTPFLLALKVPVCAATVVMAAPLAGLFALTDPPNHEGRRALDHGVDYNCGPPYALSY